MDTISDTDSDMDKFKTSSGVMKKKSSEFSMLPKTSGSETDSDMRFRQLLWPYDKGPKFYEMTMLRFLYGEYKVIFFQ